MIWISLTLFPWFADGRFDWCRHWPLVGGPTIESRLATWDAAHYLYLAKNGYQKDDIACAFYPLWPGLIRLFSIVTRIDIFTSGILLANVLSLAAVFLFHYLVRSQHGLETAKVATAFLLAFPGSIFFSFIYTEPLFLLLVVLFFIFLFQENYWGVAATGFLLSLTKAVGIFCVLPLLWQLFALRRPARLALAACGPVLGYISYFFVMFAFTGNPWEGFEAQKYYENRPSIANMFNLKGMFATFCEIQDFGAALDRVLFLVFLGSLFWVYRLNKTYFVFALAAGAIPALSTWFVSYRRQIMMCFPLFIALGHHLKGRDNRLPRWYLLAVMAAIQSFFLVRYLNFMWAG
jgi:hypothetical protein